MLLLTVFPFSQPFSLFLLVFFGKGFNSYDPRCQVNRLQWDHEISFTLFWRHVIYVAVIISRTYRSYNKKKTTTVTATMAATRNGNELEKENIRRATATTFKTWRVDFSSSFVLLLSHSLFVLPSLAKGFSCACSYATYIWFAFGWCFSYLFGFDLEPEPK